MGDVVEELHWLSRVAEGIPGGERAAAAYRDAAATVRHAIEARDSRIAKLEAENAWQPIETAPTTHSGTRFDLWAAGERYTDCWWGSPTYGAQKGVYGWVYQSGYDCDGPVNDWVPDPMHWRPLPTPPKGADQ